VTKRVFSLHRAARRQRIPRMMDNDSTDHDDSFLLDLEPLEAISTTECLEHLTELLTTSSSGPPEHARLLASLHPYERFARFESNVAEILGVSNVQAAAALSQIDDVSAWQQVAPGISLLPLTAAADCDYAVSAFLRVDAGTAFPRHEHLGEELTYVLQGAFEDDATGRRFGPGEPAHMGSATQHAFVVPAAGPHLVGLVTIRAGFRLV
jgi:ChrR Cupin-like domain